MLYEKATAEIISFDGLISSTIVGSKTVYGSLADYVVSHCACETVGISYGNDGNGGFTCTPFNGVGTAYVYINGKIESVSFYDDPPVGDDHYSCSLYLQ